MFERLSSLLYRPQVPEVDVEGADRQRDAGSQLVDVREPDEWHAAHIPGTIHIPLGDLAKRAGELDPARPVIALCRSGNRSRFAVTILQRAGFPGCSSLAGGIVAWERAGKQVERSRPAAR